MQTNASIVYSLSRSRRTTSDRLYSVWRAYGVCVFPYIGVILYSEYGWDCIYHTCDSLLIVCSSEYAYRWSSAGYSSFSTYVADIDKSKMCNAHAVYCACIGRKRWIRWVSLFCCPTYCPMRRLTLFDLSDPVAHESYSRKVAWNRRGEKQISAFE